MERSERSTEDPDPDSPVYVSCSENLLDFEHQTSPAGTVALCSGCARFWNMICSHPFETDQDFRSASASINLWHLRQGQLPSSQLKCPLCRWLHPVFASIGIVADTTHFEFADLEVYGPRYSQPLQGVPALIADKYRSTGHMIGLLPSQQCKRTFTPRLIGAHSIDYSFLRAWLHQCEQEHLMTCLPTDLKPLATSKVIHCQTRKVVQMRTACSYAALSYVWGNCLDDAPVSSGFPQTVEDAMTVTQALGFEYICKSQ